MVDTHAVLALPQLCKDDSQLPLFFDGFTNMVRDGRLTFPDLVVKECQKYAYGEHVYTWINAASGHRTHRAVPGQWQESVLGMCEEILDMDGEMEQAPLFVAAMALMLKEQISEVYVVTEDRRDLPERKCLTEACKDIDVVTISAQELAIRNGLESYL
ncbi:hypothetical protein ABZ684_13710 [Streptomyces sp. NPDC006995]|uniref:hypothetical protein n=1 Tax=Streptomyces sp. NPDC006995 TaxID=3156907 RepID=UPI0033C55219